ncbi:DUF6274 family protein [Streptomyces hypolithicus]
MGASTVRHETRALLRAHLAASTGFRHLTRHCPICHRLLRLALEPEAAEEAEANGEPVEPEAYGDAAGNAEDHAEDQGPSSP